MSEIADAAQRQKNARLLGENARLIQEQRAKSILSSAFTGETIMQTSGTCPPLSGNTSIRRPKGSKKR